MILTLSFISLAAVAQGGGKEITGYLGDDTIYGTTYSDQLRGGAGNDNIDGSWGNDKIFGQGGRDTLLGDDGRDKIYGGSGDDVITGGKDADILRGGDGADRLEGQDGVDVLYGGKGSDHFVFRSTPLRWDEEKYEDVIKDFERGKDVIDILAKDRESGITLGEPNSGQLGIKSDAGGVTIANVSGSLSVRVEGVTELDASDFVFHRSYYGDDWANNVISGGEGDDYILGGRIDDVLSGAGGKDYIYGREGNDKLDGGAGDDVLDGYEGADILTGGSGADRFICENFTSIDMIRDFESGTDKVSLNKEYFNGTIHLVKGEPGLYQLGVTKDTAGLTVFNHEHTFALRFEGLTEIHDSDFIFN